MLEPGATIGILGGGQLGRMLALAAAPLGYKVLIFCPEENAPAFNACSDQIIADYRDLMALNAFASRCDVVTFEFENIPAETVEFLTKSVPVRPGAKALSVAQDRLREKECFVSLGIEVAPFHKVDSLDELKKAVDKLGTPSILKTRRLGYDGKGQVRINTADECEEAFEAMKGTPAILEGFVAFEAETSILIARDLLDQTQSFELVRNEHRNHILNTSTVPAGFSKDLEDQAIAYGKKVAEALDYVGLLAIEFFVVADGTHKKLIANECAPRVHNSGHWTMDASQVSQFEQHIRAITGLPLIAPIRFCDVIMENLIGDDISKLGTAAENPATRLHHYGKTEVREGRKMGHLNHLKPE